MTFRDRWLRRTDDARRTKGDPPPTYAQLMADIRQTQAALALAEQIATNLRHQCDGLERENARLRLAGAEKTEYVEELALELAKATGLDPKPTLREERLRFPVWPEYTYEATYQPAPEEKP